jgi:hypothetical protein
VTVSRVGVALAIAVALAGARGLRAQSARDLVAQGVHAYRALEYDAAAAWLRKSLADDAAGTLSTVERAQALSYLAATELFRGQRDSATLAFREIVLLDPRYRPDELIFPPQVTNLFQEVRRTTKAVAVAVRPVTELRVRSERFSARLLTSSLADVTVTLAREDGTPIRELYSGPVADSLIVTWDGLTAAGAPAEDGRYVLRVAPRAGATTGTDGLRARQVALDIKQQPPDTLLWPPPLTTPPLLPERTPAAPALRPLAVGLVAAAAVVALPSVVASGRTTTAARFGVGAAVGVSGLVGFFARRPGRPLEANVRANAPQREAWNRRFDAVKAENAIRRSIVRLVIRAGPQTVAEGGTP